MPEIAFLTGVDDPLGFARRLIRKGHREGARIAVLAPTVWLTRLDHDLWAETSAEFLPHLRPRQAVLSPAAVRLTPVWLLDDLRDDLDCSTVINLGLEADVRWLTLHARVAEVVSLDPAEQRAARLRWKAYEALGLRPDHRAVGQTPGQAA